MYQLPLHLRASGDRIAEEANAAPTVTDALRLSLKSLNRQASAAARQFPLWRLTIAFVCFITLIAVIQRTSGAPQAQPLAHFLMNRRISSADYLCNDYISRGLGSNPMAFAKDYYFHLPYFAVGYWPPLFYALEGIWMHIFGDSRQSVLWMIALFGACLATVFYWVLQDRYDRWTATLGGAMFLLVPTIQWSTSLVMIDLVCSLFALSSLLFFARFLRTGRWQDSAWFGFLCAIALLTKNSTCFLLVVPPIVIVASRRWTLLRKWELYLGPAIAVGLYLPWLAISNSFLWLGFNGLPHLTLWGLLRNYVVVFWRELSFLLPLAALGLVSWVFSKRTEPDYVSWCLLALFPAIPLSNFIVRMPIESRYLILSFGAAMFLVCEFWAAILPARGRPVAMTATFVVFAAISWMHFPSFPRNDMHAAVSFLTARDAGGDPGAVIVPSSQEGPWIAEFAQDDSVRFKRIILRPTKVFGKEDWNGEPLGAV